MSNESILVVDDEPDIRNLVREILEDEGYRVDVAEDANSARAKRLREEPDLVLLDIWMPDEDGVSLLKEWKEKDQLQCPVVMMSGHGTVETAVEATRLGAYDFVEKPLSLAKLLLTVEQALAIGRRDAGAVKGVVSVQELIGASPVMSALREQAQRIAAHNAPALISGEAGSGKRALAGYIHACSSQPRGPFVEAAITPAGAEQTSEFEHGTLESLFDSARGGTLYVAELTELSAAAQQQLLRLAKNEAELRAVRLIAATRRHPERSLETGLLREDLYFLIGALHLQVPPLREHREDVSALLEYFVNYFAQHEGLSYRHFNLAAQNRLRNYDWPGNVSELRNLVSRAMILGSGIEIGLDEVEESLRQSDVHEHVPPGLMPLPLDLPLRQAREAFERAYLEQQLHAVRGNISELAKRAGVERTHLYRKMRSLGISPQKNRN